MRKGLADFVAKKKVSEGEVFENVLYKDRRYNICLMDDQNRLGGRADYTAYKQSGRSIEVFLSELPETSVLEAKLSAFAQKCNELTEERRKSKAASN